MKKKIVFIFIAVAMFTSIIVLNIIQPKAKTIKTEFRNSTLTITNQEPVISNDIECENLIRNMTESIQNKNWTSYVKLMSYEDKEFYDSYFKNDSYKDGVKQIDNISLASIQKLSFDQVEEELLYAEYPILETSDDIKPYLVGLDCKVKEENVFFYNGINYYLIVFAKETDGTYKVAQFNRPSSNLAKNVIENTLSKTSDNYERKMAALEVLECADEGIVIIRSFT